MAFKIITLSHTRIILFFLMSVSVSNSFRALFVLFLTLVCLWIVSSSDCYLIQETVSLWLTLWFFALCHFLTIRFFGLCHFLTACLIRWRFYKKKVIHWMILRFLIILKWNICLKVSYWVLEFCWKILVIQAERIHLIDNNIECEMWHLF